MRDQNKSVFWWRVVTAALLYVEVVLPPPVVGPKIEGVVVEGVVPVVGVFGLVEGLIVGVVLLLPAVLITENMANINQQQAIDM